MEQLHNCPNCGGYLSDSGRCEFCGSKVFDFLTIDFNARNMPSVKTYVRLKANGKITLAPVIIDTMEVKIKSDDYVSDFFDGRLYIHRPCYPEMNINFIVVGDMITIDAGTDMGGEEK